MRVLASAILTVVMVSTMSSAHAQTYNPNYPVCLKIIENFAETAAGLPAQCIVNPFYASARPGPGEGYRR